MNIVKMETLAHWGLLRQKQQDKKAEETKGRKNVSEERK
jgi:hypothetical protein